jgi:hypothetical protein
VKLAATAKDFPPQVKEEVKAAIAQPEKEEEKSLPPTAITTSSTVGSLPGESAIPSQYKPIISQIVKSKELQIRSDYKSKLNGLQVKLESLKKSKMLLIKDKARFQDESRILADQFMRRFADELSRVQTRFNVRRDTLEHFAREERNHLQNRTRFLELEHKDMQHKLKVSE